MEYTNFDGANLTGATIEYANLKSSSFRNAILKDAKIVGADLTDVNFQYADFLQARISSNVTLNADFCNSRKSDGTRNSECSR